MNEKLADPSIDLNAGSSIQNLIPLLINYHSMKMSVEIDQFSYVKKLAMLTQLYLELRLPLQNALRAAEADLSNWWFDATPDRRALGDAAVNNALGLQPDLPEVHLAYATHLYLAYRDYERARVQLAIARRGLVNNAQAILLEAYMDRRQGRFEKAIQEFNEAITRDPANTVAITELAHTFYNMRQFHAAEQAFERLIELLPEQLVIKAQKAWDVIFMETGVDTAARSAIAALPASMANDSNALWIRLDLALNDRDWRGRLDVSSPLQTAWQLHQRWSKSRLIVVEIEGHSGAVMANEFTKAIANFVPAPLTVCSSRFSVRPITNHLSRRPLTSHFSHQCAAAAAPALVFLQSQIVADPTKRITPSARKHSLYAITYEFV